MKKSIITTVLFAVFLFSFFIMCLCLPKQEYSESERRYFSNFPVLKVDDELNENFMTDFEIYSADHFPFRETFRSIKALFNKNVLMKLDKNDLFVAENHISKLGNKINTKMLDYSSELFFSIYNSYLKDNNTNVYLSIVPDKNYFLASQNGYPDMDYDLFIQEFVSKNKYMKYIDIVENLSLDDYYYTDTHWRQEKIVDVADKLIYSMGKENKDSIYIENILDIPFNGVYKGQLALPFKSDTIKYITNNTIDNSIVTYYNDGTPKIGKMYNMDKANGKDPYEMFLSGVAPLIVIENNNIENGEELVIFRDSYGSSIAPLLTGAYKKITIIDLRYINSSILGNFVDFANKDVLFLYSTTILNNSRSMK